MKKIIFLFAFMASVSVFAADVSFTYEGNSFDFNYVSETQTELKLVSLNSSNYNVVIPEYVNGLPVTVIGTKSLYSKSITSLLLPRTIKLIETQAIYSTQPLPVIVIPENVDSIAQNAIQLNSSNVVDITWLPKNCHVDKQWLNGWSSGSTGTLLIGKTCQRIPDYFMYNKYIPEVVIPYGVKSIGDYAFFNCSRLEEVEIGESVTSIGHMAFYNCYKLKNIVLAPATPPTCPAYALHNVPLDAIIEVPCNSINAYASAPEWCYFWAFEETILYKATGRSNAPEKGSVEVEQDCRCATFTATPADGCRFKCWSNGSTQNPLTVDLHESIELTAEFEDMPSGLEDIIETNPTATKVLIDGQIYILRDGVAYNTFGQIIR